MSTEIDRLRGFDPLNGGSAAGRRYLLLDVFGEQLFTGNPLAVFLDGSGLGTAQMQALARELNLSESVFLLAPEGAATVAARIFTPGAELPFAGHPSLGAATIVSWALGLRRVDLQTGAGVIALELDGGGPPVARGSMAQPLPSWEPFDRAEELLAAVGVDSSGLPVEVYCNGPHHVFIELANVAAVAALSPDLGAVAALGALNVSCFAGAGSSWTTRMFAPGIGVPEDPATGSAAGPLAVHLARHGRISFGTDIEIHQGEALGRPSLLIASAHGDAARLERVNVGGAATLVGGGAILLG